MIESFRGDDEGAGIPVEVQIGDSELDEGVHEIVLGIDEGFLRLEEVARRRVAAQHELVDRLDATLGHRRPRAPGSCRTRGPPRQSGGHPGSRSSPVPRCSSKLADRRLRDRGGPRGGSRSPTAGRGRMSASTLAVYLPSWKRTLKGFRFSESGLRGQPRGSGRAASAFSATVIRRLASSIWSRTFWRSRRSSIPRSQRDASRRRRTAGRSASRAPRAPFSSRITARSTGIPSSVLERRRAAPGSCCAARRRGCGP